MVCVSSKTRCEVKKVPRRNCEIISLPLKLELFEPLKPKKRGNMIIHIGTSPVKNPWISIKAVKILRKKGYDVKLMVLGSPAMLPRVEGVEYRIISKKELPELLCKSKALILPSSYETFPYACLEAMACGTPVVVSNAIPEEVVIDGFNGIRVNSFNPVDYANALEKLLLGNDGLWLNLSRNAFSFVKRFNYIDIAKKPSVSSRNIVK